MCEREGWMCEEANGQTKEGLNWEGKYVFKRKNELCQPMVHGCVCPHSSWLNGG